MAGPHLSRGRVCGDRSGEAGGGLKVCCNQNISKKDCNILMDRLYFSKHRGEKFRMKIEVEESRQFVVFGP